MSGGFYQPACLACGSKTEGQIHARAPEEIVARHRTNQTSGTDQWLADGHCDFHTFEDLVVFDETLFLLASGPYAAFQHPA
jgi:hypothetical protein